MNKPAHNTLAAERRKARHYGMQALYQWQMTGQDAREILKQFQRRRDNDQKIVIQTKAERSEEKSRDEKSREER